MLCKHLVCLGYRLGSLWLCNRVVWLGYRLDGLWLGCWQGQDNFHIGSLGAHPTSRAVGTGDYFLEWKVFRRAADPHLHLVLQLAVSAADPHLHLVLQLAVSAAKPLLPYIPSWHVQWQLYLCCQGRRVLAYSSKMLVPVQVPVPISQTTHNISLKTVTLRVELSGFMGMSFHLYWDRQCCLLVGHIVLNDMSFRHSYLGNSFYSKFANIIKSSNNSECVCVCVFVCLAENSRSLRQWNDLLKGASSVTQAGSLFHVITIICHFLHLLCCTVSSQRVDCMSMIQ